MNENIKKVAFGSEDKPLKIGKLEISCYVLEDGTRVLVQTGLQLALGMTAGGGRTGHAQGGNKLSQFAMTKGIQPYISKEVLARAENPIKFKLRNGTLAHGYEATLLPDICNAVLQSREDKKLNARQIHIAKQCEIVVRGLAIIGIIALVDEATGYQEIRDREALQKILDKYITDEWAKWTKTFPDDYYKELFRLKGMEYPPRTKNKPSYIGHWTNDIVYKRLTPSILKVLKEKNPKNEKGNRLHRFHQSLTRDYGDPKLREHLANIIFLMKGCQTWSDFERRLNRASPKYGETIPLDFPEKNEK